MSKLYLAQFRIGRKEVLRHRLVSAYELHKLLWNCFPGRPEAKRDFLFRCDEEEAVLKILMLSETKPEVCDWAEWDGIKEFDPVFPIGSLYCFRLRANPTIRAKEDGKLRAVTREEELHSWLVRKAEKNGFALRSEPEYSGCRLERFSKTPGGPGISLNVVEIGGALAVTDSAAFGEAFRRGIGRGRAFGCGMLLLKRIEL